MSFGKNRLISGRSAKILMAALMIALVVIPASAYTCSKTCTAYKKVPGGSTVDEYRYPVVYTFIDFEGNKLGLQLTQVRSCGAAVNERTCWDRVACPVGKNYKCEKILPGYPEQKPAKGYVCSGWTTIDWEVICLGPNC